MTPAELDDHAPARVLVRFPLGTRPIDVWVTAASLDARPPEQRSCPLVLALHWPSRGRHEQSNAAKISGDGARAAEIGRRRRSDRRTSCAAQATGWRTRPSRRMSANVPERAVEISEGNPSQVCDRLAKHPRAGKDLDAAGLGLVDGRGDALAVTASLRDAGVPPGAGARPGPSRGTFVVCCAGAGVVRTIPSKSWLRSSRRGPRTAATFEGAAQVLPGASLLLLPSLRRLKFLDEDLNRSVFAVGAIAVDAGDGTPAPGASCWVRMQNATWRAATVEV